MITGIRPYARYHTRTDSSFDGPDDSSCGVHEGHDEDGSKIENPINFETALLREGGAPLLDRARAAAARRGAWRPWAVSLDGRPTAAWVCSCTHLVGCLP